MEIIYYLVVFIILLSFIKSKKKDFIKDDPKCIISLQEEYNSLLKENIRENQMTEHPVTHAEVVEMTKREFCMKYNDSHIQYYIKT